MIEKMQKLIEVQESFDFVPSTSNSRPVKFKKEGKIEGDPVAKRWKLLSSSGEEPAILIQSDEGGFVARLNWDGKTFYGRDSVGVCELRSKQSDEWIDFFRPKREGLLDMSFAVTEKKVIDNPDSKVKKTDFSYDIKPFINVDVDKYDTAIGIIACDRPGYFDMFMKSLLTNKTLTDYPIFLFIDLPEDQSKYSLMHEVERLAHENLPNLSIIPRSVNFGCGRNIIDARDKLLSTLGFKKAFIFEDDMEVSSTYLKFCESMWSWSRQFSNVGAVQGWSKCLLNNEEKKKRNKEVHVTYTNLWGYLMGADCWSAIREDFIDYADKFMQEAYNRRNSQVIHTWMDTWRKLDFKPTGDNPISLDSNSLRHKQYHFENTPTGQDGTTNVLMHGHGFVRLASSVNRGVYIGREGIHSTPAMFRKDKYDLVSMFNGPSDNRIKKFEVRNV